MRISEYYNQIVQSLADAVGDEAQLEAKLLICHALDLELDRFFTKLNEELTSANMEQISSMADKRKTGCPLQYILGSWWFYGREFVVNPACLIPRQDTEILCEVAINSVRRNSYKTMLDMCTGSGCIGITVGAETDIDLTLSDISAPALAVAKLNAAKNKVEALLIKSDLFANIEGSFDLITINPPYLSQGDMEVLQREVSFEPYNALFGGSDGLDFYRRIKDEYKKHLNPDGMLILEIGATQAQAVVGLFGGEVIKDLGGNDRVVVVKLH